MYATSSLRRVPGKQWIFSLLKRGMLLRSGPGQQSARGIQSFVQFSKLPFSKVPSAWLHHFPHGPRTKRLPLATCVGPWRTYSSSDDKSEGDSAVATQEQETKTMVPKLSEMTRLMSLAKPEAARLSGRQLASHPWFNSFSSCIWQCLVLTSHLTNIGIEAGLA